MKKYSINQMSKLFNISTQTIRFYERKGLLHPSRNHDNNYREYDAKDIHELYYVLKYNRLGMKIADFSNHKDILNKTSVEDLKNLISIQKKEIQIKSAICSYIEDSISEEDEYWENPITKKEIHNFTLYSMNLDKCLTEKYSEEWKKLIPIASIMSSRTISQNTIQFGDFYYVLREKYFQIIQEQVNIDLNTLDKIYIHSGIQIIIQTNEEINDSKLIHEYTNLQNQYHTLMDTFYMIPLLSVYTDDDGNNFNLVKVIFPLAE